MANYNKRSHQAIWSLVRWCARSTFVAKASEIAGHVASYALWQRSRDMRKARSYLSREGMWKSAVPRLADGPVTVLEFGVAGGAATRFLLGAIKNRDLCWHGFDTFTGLPQTWSRGGLVFAEKGAFDAGGAPPEINDPRVTWHVGLVEDTLPKITLDASDRLFVLFDLDLYEPTAFALEWIASRLKPGDLLYFDEAYDPWHERRLLDEFLDQGHRVKALGTTGIALLLEFEGRS